MQDFQPIPDLSGRIFAGSDASTTRRLRPYPTTTHHQLQPIKCPRCESANTKFCYYNNYNLSQPRHFCKACRRYWTKGGVLRNVPVGGGCRKNSKRSSSNSKPKPDKPPSLPASASASASGSSSDSSSNPNPHPNRNLDLIPDPQPPQPQIFAENFTDGFNFADQGLLPDPGQGKGLNGSDLGNGSDWGNGSDSGSLFDMMSSVDPAAYWNQSHWGDTDPSLYLP